MKLSEKKYWMYVYHWLIFGANSIPDGRHIGNQKNVQSPVNFTGSQSNAFTKMLFKYRKQWKTISIRLWWELHVQDLRQVFLFLRCDFFLCGPSRTFSAPVVEDPAACMPAGSRITSVEERAREREKKTSYLWLLKGQKKKLTVAFSPRGNGLRKPVKG